MGMGMGMGMGIGRLIMWSIVFCIISKVRVYEFRVSAFRIKYFILSSN
jgi:hypothetical protein